MWPSSPWCLCSSLWLTESLLLKTKNAWSREALCEFLKEVREGCSDEQLPLRNVDSSKCLFKKANKKQLGLGKLRHKGVKINVLILCLRLKQSLNKNLCRLQLGISFTGPALLSRKRKSHFKVIIVKRPQVPQCCKRLPRSYLIWIILVLFFWLEVIGKC